MMEQEVVDYISQAQKHGLSDFEIKQNLLNVGWEAGVVEDSLVFIRAAESKTASSPLSAKQVNYSPLPDKTLNLPRLSQTEPSNPALAQPAHQAIATGEQDLAHNKQAFYKKPLLWIIIIAVIILGGGAYYVYAAYFSATPAKVINKFLTAPKAKTFNTTYSFSYTDNSAASSTGNIGLTFSGNLGSDLTDPNNIKQQNNINASLTYNIASFGVNFKYLLLGQVIYFDIGQIPQLKAFLPDQNIEWVKVDLNELKKQQTQSESQIFNQLSMSPELQNQLKSIWSKANVVKPGDSLTKENLNGVATYHVKEQFNNQAFSAALISSIQAVAAQSTSTSASFSDDDKQLITMLVNKVQVKEADLWIGQKDSEIYKFHLLVSAPTIKDFSNPDLINNAPVLSSTQSKARDAKRIADVEQMSTALQLYNNDFGGYPEAGASGQAKNLTPTYMAVWPTAPQPLDGSCTNYYNTYWYTPLGKTFVKNGVTVYPNYKLTFCLGELTGGYRAGIGELTPGGIQGNIACPTTVAKCLNGSSPGNSDAQILAAVKNMTFGAQVEIDSSYSDYGKPQNIIAPTSSTDILDIISQGMSGLLTGSEAQSAK